MIPLINPSEPVRPGSLVNNNGDLIIYKNFKMKSTNNSRIEYEFIKFLGGGSFGKVYEVIRNGEEHFSIKISSQSPDSIQQCEKEKTILKWVSLPSTNPPPYLSSLIETFSYYGHIIIVMPLYDFSLLNLLERRNYSWFPLNVVQSLLQELTTAVAFLHKNKVIHTDIKPENIMFFQKNLILIDYGGCIIYPKEGDTGYFQSLFYRAPEVILQLPYSYSIDVWSIGCVAAELALGIPIFAGKTSHNVLQLIHIRSGEIPKEMIEDSPIADYFFDSDGDLIIDPNEGVSDLCDLPMDTISNIITDYPFFNPESPEECEKEKEYRKVFIAFLEGLLKVNPEERFTIEEVLNHEFLNMSID